MSSQPPNANPSAPAADGSQQQPQQQRRRQQQQQSTTARRRLPVTLLSGFLGAGKTTLLRHLLQYAGPLRIAVVVNDVAALNIDASLLKGGSLIQSQEQLVELQNGCICCSLRVDLVAAVADLAAKGAFDLLLLESTGVSEPMQVAELFDVDVPITDILNNSSSSNDSSSSTDGPAAAAAATAAAAAVSAAAGGGDSAAAAVLLRDVSYLDTAVTVVDAHHMLANLHSIHTFRDLSAVGSSSPTPAAAAATAAPPAAAAAAAPEAALSGSHRHIAELLLEQIEVADVLLLNKADTVSEGELQLLQAMLSALNPSARLLITAHSVVAPSEVLLTGLWEAHRAQGGAAWVQLMRHDTPQQAADSQQQQQQQQQQGGHAHECSTHDGPCSHHHHQHSTSAPAAVAAATDGMGGSSSGSSGSCPCCPAAPSPAVAAAARPTSSYGVSHFVYRARLPFHPGRLHDFMVKFFILQEPDWSRMMLGDGGARGEASGTESDDSSSSGSENENEVVNQAVAAAGGMEGQSGKSDQQQQQQQQRPVQALQAVASERRAACEGAFGLLLRSKGFVWLATRGDHIGEWSQAGSLLSFSTGGPWFCVQPQEAWPAEGEAELSAILSDFAPSVGDRRQELVFIGVGLREGALRGALDSCLVTVGEMEAGLRGLPDPFEPWPDVGDMMDLGEPSEGEEAADEEDEQQQQQQQPTATQPGAAAAVGAIAAAAAAVEGDAVCWQPGQVVSLCEGAPQLQGLLDSIEATLADPTALSQAVAAAAATAAAGGGPAAAAAAAAGPPLVLIEWVAPWAAASLTLSQQLSALAGICPCLPLVRVDVSGSFANQALALEKVMEVPQVYRKGGRKFQPVPKSGEKWPCVTLHLAPSLQPQQEFSGPQTLDSLLQALLQLGCITQAAADAATAAAAAALTPAAVAATTAAAAAAACRGPLRPPFRTAALSAAEEPEQQFDAAAAAAAAAAIVDRPDRLQPASQRQQQQQQQRQFKLVKRGAADLKQLLQQVAPSQLLLLAWSPAQQPTTAAAAAAAAGDQPDTGSDSPADVIDSTDAVESLAAALAAAAAAANSSSLVVVAVADAAASTANQALAAALSVQQQPVVQLYHNRQVVKVVKVGSLGVAAAVAKVQKAVLQVLQQAREQAQQPPKQPQAVGASTVKAAAAAAADAAKAPTAPAQDSSSSSSTAAASTGTAAAAAGSSSGGAISSSSESTTTTTTSTSTSSMWDPPAPKAGKPVKAGAKLSFPASAVFGASSTGSGTVSTAASSSVSSKPGSTVKVVYWPRMPCLSCGCPYWLGEDWDATCARCGWSCEEGGYDDDSNPLPQHAQRYKDIVGELKAGRTPSGLQPLQE